MASFATKKYFTERTAILVSFLGRILSKIKKHFINFIRILLANLCFHQPNVVLLQLRQDIHNSFGVHDHVLIMYC